MTKKDLTNINGTVQAYLLNKAGQVDGLLLQDGKQLHLPPHCSSALQQAVKPGDTIEALVEPGEESPLGSEFRTQSLKNAQTGQTVVDQPPPPEPKLGEPMHIEGSMTHWLVGHKGEPKGFILDDGTYLHIPPHVGKTLTERVKSGVDAQRLVVRHRLIAHGNGTRNDFGTSLEVLNLEMNGQKLVDLSDNSAKHHKQAADHHEHAAHHHRKAAKHSEAQEHEQASEHAHRAHEHLLHATKHAEEAGKKHSDEKS